LGRPQEALESFESALKLKRNSPAVLKNRGNVLIRLGRFAEAIADFEGAVSLKPDFAEAYNDLGYALEQIPLIPSCIRRERRSLRSGPV
jgi:tetratricopeptide (TPR) repeat protein